MEAKQVNLKKLLHHGAMTKIAGELGISQPAVSDALKRGTPGHPAVRLALKMAEASGALAAAQQLATLTMAT